MAWFIIRVFGRTLVIQTNSNFQLYDLVEIREFANEVMQGQSATIDMDVWNIDESKLEDFISEQATIFVSTIHQTKGREFDNVYLVISENKGLNDADIVSCMLLLLVPRTTYIFSVQGIILMMCAQKDSLD